MEDRRAVGTAAMSLYNSYEFYFGPRKESAMNKQVNPDHCAEIDGALYMLQPVAGTPEWRVTKDGQPWRLFSSLMAARGWFDHVIAYPASMKSRLTS